jgi:hypothetical protein
MNMFLRYGALALWFLGAAGCSGESLPADVAGYQSRCQKMNTQPIRVYEDDPHEGMKDVYACNVELALLEANTRPFPEGTLIVKESTKEGFDYPWLLATARKLGGAWKWDEYTRNFGDEDFVRILASESVCTDCHRRAEPADWIFTPFSRR